MATTTPPLSPIAPRKGGRDFDAGDFVLLVELLVVSTLTRVVLLFCNSGFNKRTSASAACNIRSRNCSCHLHEVLDLCFFD